MATATYIKGEKLTIDYTCTGAVVVDQIIPYGSTNASPGTIGVALNAGTTGDVIGVDIGGCYTFPAATGAVIAQGEGVNWDNSAGKVDDTSSTLAASDIGDFAVALEAKAAATGASTIDVKLLPGHGTYATS